MPYWSVGPENLLQYAIPLWGHVVIVLGALCLIAVLEWRNDRRETRLRRNIGAARTRAEAAEAARDAAEILRDRYRRERDALSIEVAKWRKLAPPDMRLTQVMPVGSTET